MNGGRDFEVKPKENSLTYCSSTALSSRCPPRPPETAIEKEEEEEEEEGRRTRRSRRRRRRRRRPSIETSHHGAINVSREEEILSSKTRSTGSISWPPLCYEIHM